MKFRITKNEYEYRIEYEVLDGFWKKYLRWYPYYERNNFGYSSMAIFDTLEKAEEKLKKIKRDHDRVYGEWKPVESNAS